MDEKEKLLLQEILRMKLSEDAISSMQLYNTTNKNEAVHRSLSVNLPKNVCNLLKRHGGQIGIWNSQKQQHARNLSKAWTKSWPTSKTMERKLKLNIDVLHIVTQSGEKIVEHREAKLKSKEQDVYRKGQLDPVPAFLSHSTNCKRKLPPAP